MKQTDMIYQLNSVTLELDKTYDTIQHLRVSKHNNMYSTPVTVEGHTAELPIDEMIKILGNKASRLLDHQNDLISLLKEDHQ